MKLLKRLIRFIIVLIIILGIVIGYRGYNKYTTALRNMPLQEKISTIQKNKNYTKVDNLPKMYKDAVIAAEDHRFYSHGAIDVIAILRAIYVDITSMSLKEGGSTITQQLAKNVYFNRRNNSEQKSSRNFNGLKNRARL